MIQEKIYKKSIDRPLNPAVSVGDNRQNTIDVEISEYVFTAEIINGLYSLLSAVRNKSVSHNGIWISGYYGSGKSHFLKYLNFCIDKRYQEKALARLEEAVADFDPLQHPESKSQVEISDIRDLAIWLKNAKIDSILFNIGAKVDGNKGDRSTFAKALWEEFNAFRGFNKFNIALAQYLERPLAEHGKLDAFKEALEAKSQRNSEKYLFILIPPQVSDLIHRILFLMIDTWFFPENLTINFYLFLNNSFQCFWLS